MAVENGLRTIDFPFSRARRRVILPWPVSGAVSLGGNWRTCRGRKGQRYRLFTREVEKELTGRESEPSELIYFKIYKSLAPVVVRITLLLISKTEVMPLDRIGEELQLFATRGLQ